MFAIANSEGYLFEPTYETIEQAKEEIKSFYSECIEDMESCTIYELKPVVRVVLKPIYKEI